jgi:hypothetical protein
VTSAGTAFFLVNIAYRMPPAALREAKERKLEDLRLQLRTLDGDMSLVSSQLHGSRMLPAGSGGNLTEGLLSTETPQTQMPEDARADDQQGHAVDIANSNAYGT